MGCEWILVDAFDGWHAGDAFTKQKLNMHVAPAQGMLIPDGNYIISTSGNAQKLVGVPNKKNKAKARISKQSNSKLQVWTFTYEPNTDSYMIVNVRSKKALTLSGKTVVQKKALAYGSKGFEAQCWSIESTSRGYSIKSKSKGNLYLTASGASIKAKKAKKGTPTASQRFWLFDAGLWNTKSVVKNGFYTIKSAGTNLLVQPEKNMVHHESDVRATTAQVSAGNLCQIYNIQLVRKNQYKIVNAGTTHALTVDGALVVERKYTGSPQQLWRAKLNKDGTVRFTSYSTGMVLAIAGGAAVDGSGLMVAAPTKSRTQKWEISPTTTGLDAMQTKALERVSNQASDTNMSIAIDLTRHYLMLFAHDKDANTAWTLYRQWRVSNGVDRSTVACSGKKSQFRFRNPLSDGYTFYYWSRMGQYQYMHSIKYRSGTYRVLDGRLGCFNSTGCVRMSLMDAKYVYYEVPNKTKVQRYY